jgi:hypothetical protein
MPFVSEAQRRKCWLLYNRAIKAGKIPQWDCHEFETGQRKISKKSIRRPSKKTSKKTIRKTSKKTRK